MVINQFVSGDCRSDEALNQNGLLSPLPGSASYLSGAQMRARSIYVNQNRKRSQSHCFGPQVECTLVC